MRPDRTNVRGFPAENRTGLSGNTPSEGPYSGRKGRKRETGRTPQPRAFSAADRLRRQRRSGSWTENDSLNGLGTLGLPSQTLLGALPQTPPGTSPWTLHRFALHQAASRFLRRRPPSATTAKRELDGERFSLRGWDVGTAVPNPARGAAPDPARGIAP